MLSRKMSNHRTKERSTEAQHHLALSRAGCPFPAGSARWRLACCGAGTWRWVACADGPWREAAALPRPPSFGAPQLPPPLPASSSLLGSGWVLGKSSPLPSANLQGPGSMGTVRLVQNMCKMIFLQAKLKDTRLTKVLSVRATAGS